MLSLASRSPAKSHECVKIEVKAILERIQHIIGACLATSSREPMKAFYELQENESRRAPEAFHIKVTFKEKIANSDIGREVSWFVGEKSSFETEYRAKIFCRISFTSTSGNDERNNVLSVLLYPH